MTTSRLIDLSRYLDLLEDVAPYPVVGAVTRVIGITAECRGVTMRLGDLCEIESERSTDGAPLIAEAIGFKGDVTVLMPFSDLAGIAPGAKVRALHAPLTAPCGDALLGRVLDGLGRPQDGGPPLHGVTLVPVNRDAPAPAARRPIKEPLVTGVRALDGLLTLGRGQRVGIFAGAGVGKSTLLGALAARSEADVTVIGLIGERGREVYDFVRNSLGPAGLARAVVVAAPSDSPPLIRAKAPFTATAIAEGFRDQGKNVLLVMDSLTRFAAAAREIGLALGEPPTAKGYPPSLFSLLPKLVERPGAFKNGSITAVYTVLVEGDDLTEPLADATRSLLDGHIVLARSIAERGRFPAVDVLGSVSRLMTELVTPAQSKVARRLRKLMATHRDHKDLIDVGAYKPGADPDVDDSVARIGRIEEFLSQDLSSATRFPATLEWMERAAFGAATAANAVAGGGRG